MTNELTPTRNTLVLAKPRPQDQNPALVYLASLPSDTGRRTQFQVLRVISDLLGGSVDTIDWSSLRYQHTAALRSRIIETGYSPASTRKFLCAIRGVLKNAWRLGQIGAEDYQRAIDLDGITGSGEMVGRYMEPEEIEKMIAVCMKDPSASGPRDAAIIAMMYGCLVRRAGIVALNYEDYHPRTGEVIIHGKRKKIYSVFLTNGGADAMADWIKLRGREPGPLFNPVHRSGVIHTGIRLKKDANAIYNMIQKRALAAGIEHTSPHNFRRTGISDFLASGVDSIMVVSIAGQDDPKTTKKYDRRPAELKKEAAEKLSLPYERRTS